MAKIQKPDIRTWGERLFYPEVRGRKAKAEKRIYTRTSPERAQKIKLDSIKNKLRHVVTKSPEVMIKKTGGNKSFKAIKSHIDYISRNGKVDLENEKEEVFKRKISMEEIKEFYGEGEGLELDEQEEAEHQITYNFVFSMPKGTERNAFENATKSFIHQEFGDNHQYLMAAHHDTESPHVHVSIKAKGHDGKRIKITKAATEERRERYAEFLNERGIKASATRRYVRGQFEKSPKHKDPSKRQNNRRMAEKHAEQSVLQKMQRRDNYFKNKWKEKARNGEKYEEPASVTQAKQTRKEVIGMYRDAIKDLENGNVRDQMLAKQTRIFVEDMDKIMPQEEVIFKKESARIKYERDQKRRDKEKIKNKDQDLTR